MSEHPPEHLSAQRRKISDELFKKFDLDGNGAVSLSELYQVIEACEQRRQAGHPGAPVDDKLKRARSKWMSSVKSQIAQVREQVKRRQSSASFSLKSSTGSHANLGQIVFLGDCLKGDGDPSLDPDAFAEFIRVFSGNYTEEEFGIFTNELLSAVQLAYDNTHGSKKKKLIWELFQLVDVNHDQVIDMNELKILLHIESKRDKKAIARWKAILMQRRMDNKREGSTLASSTIGNAPGRSSPPGAMHASINSGASAANTIAGMGANVASSANVMASSQRHITFAGSAPGSGPLVAPGKTNSDVGTSGGLSRKKSIFVSGSDGILHLKDEEVTGVSDDDKDSTDKENPPLTLKDFQEFLQDFYGDDVDRIEATCNAVRQAILETHRRYLTEMKVDQIVNDILGDLLRERPHDVLDGILRSVRRLQRLGNFPTQFYRTWSISSHPFLGDDDSTTDANLTAVAAAAAAAH